MKADDRLILPEDVVIAPVDWFAPELRRVADADERVVTRLRSRARSVVVDAAAAAFLERFRSPCTVIEAVMKHAEEALVDPVELLEAAGPLLVRLREHHLLAVDGDETVAHVEPTMRAGDLVGGARVVHCVHLFGDVEVYRARDASGVEVALKILRPPVTERSLAMLDREEVVLTHLAGGPAPKLLGRSTLDDRPYLVTGWCPGVDAARAAHARRAASDAAIAPETLALCRDVLVAYVELHRRGVVHGDVHPGNVRVSPTGEVFLLDFGLSHCPEVDGHLSPPRRGGLHEYLEPEYCAALLQKAAPPAASSRSDVYAMGAMLYRLMTGWPCLDFSLDREGWLRQVVEGGPVSFAARALPPWPEIEAVLARALAVDPAGRWASMHELSRAFEEAIAARRPPAWVSASTRVPPFVAATLERMAPARAGRIAEAFDAMLAPRASINFGAAGAAWFLYRVAALRGDARLLSAADVWCERAARTSDASDAFEAPDINITREVIGRLSPFHNVSGIHLVRAHIARALGDVAGAARASRAFVDACAVRCDNPDLTVGATAALLGCSALLEALPRSEHIDRASVQALGSRLMAEVEAWMTKHELASPDSPTWVGLAHGWAGLLFGSLRWSQATGAEPPPLVRERLTDLAALALHEDDRVSWPVQIGSRARANEAFTGWCHGSAGHVLLWNLAARVLSDDGFADLARGATRHLDQARGSGRNVDGSLCCGYAGQGFAMLAMYRSTRNLYFLSLARDFSERAVRFAASSTRRDALYKGDLGVALLAEEIAHPEMSCMPLLEAEGWAPSAT